MSDFSDFEHLIRTERKTAQLIFEEMQYFHDLVLNKDFTELYGYIKTTSIYFSTPENIRKKK